MAVLGLALVATACGGGANGETAADGPTEGIQVHGDWEVQVVDPDGTVVSSVEFANSLLPPGRQILVNPLTRAWVPGSWYVEVGRH